MLRAGVCIGVSGIALIVLAGVGGFLDRPAVAADASPSGRRMTKDSLADSFNLPRPSDHIELSAARWTPRADARVGDVFQSLRERLGRQGFEYTVRRLADSNIALVTKVQEVRRGGARSPRGRHYRSFIIVIGGGVESARRPGSATRGGAAWIDATEHLPAQLAGRAFSRLHVFLYEYAQDAVGTSWTLISNPRFPVEQQIVDARIWNDRELRKNP